MTDSNQLLHELGRLKAQRAATRMQLSRSVHERAREVTRGESAIATSPAEPAAVRTARTARPELHLVTDFAGIVLEADPELAALVSERAALKDARLRDLVAPECREDLDALFDRIGGIARADTFAWRGLLRTLRAGDVPVGASVIAQPGGAGTLSWLLRLAEPAAATPHRSFSELAFAAAADAMMFTDARGRILAVNPAFARLTGYSAAEVVGKPASILRSGRHGSGFYERMWRRLHEAGEWSGEIWNRHADGETRPSWLAISRVADGEGGSAGYLAVLQDISVFKDAESRLNHLAHHDPLTGLPNRLLFQDRVTQQLVLAKRDNERVAVLYLDLDRFKNLNEEFGHEAADRLLHQVAGRVKAVVREQDTVARLGADVFTVLVPRMKDHQDAVTVAGKLLKAMLPPFAVDGRAQCVSASIGIAVFPDHASGLSELQQCAEQAVAAAKRSGGGCMRGYSRELLRQNVVWPAIEGALARALDKKELELHYQPQVDAASGRIAGAEALLRWRHPALGPVAPAEFIRVAERTGKIVPIGEWVVREACRQSRAWRASGLPPLRIAVNVSSRQLEDPNFVRIVEAGLADGDLAPELLELEITETDFSEYSPTVLQTLARLGERGVKIAIDDFGIGYSSLDRIKKLPVSRIKIDQSFVHDLLSHRRSGAIAAAIISLGEALHLDVTAEGVESEAQYRSLLEKGCGEMQGYFFGRPMSAADFSSYLRTA
ncbi:MAG: EAL domain-containing protein [Burkholderiales bacterium]|nr:EAL domain-containing protein [Burkholderiales bacterium]